MMDLDVTSTRPRPALAGETPIAYVVGALMVALAVLLLAGQAAGQAFPLVLPDETLDDVEERAERIEARRAEAVNREQEAAALDDEREEKWEALVDYVDDHTDFLAEARRNNAWDRRRSALTSEGRAYRLGRLFLALGSFRNASAQFRDSSNAEEPRQRAHVFNGLLDEWAIRYEVIEGIAEEVEGPRNSLARTIERFVGLVDRRLDIPLPARQAGRYTDARATRLAAFRIWLGNVEQLLVERARLRALAEEKALQAQVVYNYAVFLADESKLGLTHLARAWFQAIEEVFPTHPLVLSGRTQSQIAAMLARQGLTDAGTRAIAEAATRGGVFYPSIAETADAVGAKISAADEANETPELTLEEQALAPLSSAPARAVHQRASEQLRTASQTAVNQMRDRITAEADL